MNTAYLRTKNHRNGSYSRFPHMTVRKEWQPEWLRKLCYAYQEAADLRYSTYDTTKVDPELLDDLTKDYWNAKAAVDAGFLTWDKQKNCQHDWNPITDLCDDCGMELADYRDQQEGGR